MAGTEIKLIPKASTDMKLQKTNLRLARKDSRKSSCLEQVMIFQDFTPHRMKALAPSSAGSASPSFIIKLCFCTWITDSETTSCSESGLNILFYNFTLVL